MSTEDTPVILRVMTGPDTMTLVYKSHEGLVCRDLFIITEGWIGEWWCWVQIQGAIAEQVFNTPLSEWRARLWLRQMK